MFEFLEKNTSVNTNIETVGFIIALVCLIRDKNWFWRGMVLYLFITCLTELIGLHIKKLYLADMAHVHPNIWIYNILLIFQAAFISVMFQHLLSRYIDSKLIIICGLALLGVLYVYEVFDHGVFVKHNLTTTTMSVLFVVYSLYYFYHVLRDDRYLSLWHDASFWWVAGILLFYFGSIASVLYFQMLATISLHARTTYPIYRILIIMLYGCWSYAFICRKWLSPGLKT
ncbi:hypothetical protein BEL04_13580 [Mucilaginibacter sp. PPCGB 2223]|nr:hypothetical protein BEL04_13580 [Mucilaginibacter sp. PPCGB 2223]